MSTTRRGLRTRIAGGRDGVVWLIAAAMLLAPQVGLAHTGEGVVGGFLSGVTHPIFGFDHVVAMVAVGLWGAFLGQPAIWLLPVVFPVIMAFGGLAGVLGMPLPGVETGIALSALALGAMVALALRPPLWVAAILSIGFAIRRNRELVGSLLDDHLTGFSHPSPAWRPA
jgi:urease accessory protein